MASTDPHGFDPHAPGAKLDAGKVRVELVLAAFSRALWEVAKVGSYGAEKYSPNGWLSVPDAEARYLDAKGRHWLKNAMGERVDPDTGLDHLAHEAWNALAVLELRLRARKRVV